MDTLWRPIARQCAKAFGVPIFQVEEAFMQDANSEMLKSMCQPDGPAKLLVYLGREPDTAVGHNEDEDDPEIYVTTGDTDRFVQRGILLLKSGGDGGELTSAADLEAHVSCSVLLGTPAKSLLATLEHLFAPTLAASVGTWGAQLSDERGSDEFFGALHKYVGSLSDAVNGVEGGIELVRPTVRTTDGIELKPAALTRAAASPELVASFEATVSEWVVTLEKLLSSGPPPVETVPDGDQGPR